MVARANGSSVSRAENGGERPVECEVLQLKRCETQRP